MKKTTPTKKQLVKGLKSQVKTLQTELVEVKKISGIDDFINVKIKKNQSRFERIKNPSGADKGIGRYLMILDMTAKKDAVFVPISIASGKKTTGFMYQIEGTAEGLISTASVECSGEGVTQITSGTIVYSKIPAGKTGSFRIQFEIKGKVGKTYTVIINRINYKLNVRDSRYKQFLKETPTDSLRFD